MSYPKDAIARLTMDLRQNWLHDPDAREFLGMLDQHQRDTVAREREALGQPAPASEHSLAEEMVDEPEGVPPLPEEVVRPITQEQVPVENEPKSSPDPLHEHVD